MNPQPFAGQSAAVFGVHWLAPPHMLGVPPPLGEAPPHEGAPIACASCEANRSAHGRSQSAERLMQKHLIVPTCLTVVALTMFSCSSTVDRPAPRPSPIHPGRVKPNVVLFLLDDVGFGHLGPYGGAIRTPNIERVAQKGLRLTRFHTSGASSSSRAALLTGRWARGSAGVVPITTSTFVGALRSAGYATAAIGKWHNTPAEHVTPHGPYGLWPTSLGFEHFYGFFGAEADHWAPSLWHDRWPIDPAAGQAGYLLERDLGDRAIQFIRQKDTTGEPFVLYLSPGTGHAPHHATRELVEGNHGAFDRGWDAGREETFARQKRLGIVPGDAELPPRPDVVPAWSDLGDDQRRLFSRMQEVHAASLQLADEQLGRVLDELEDTGMLENTIVIVTSDEGASGDGGLLGAANALRLANGLPARLDIDALADLGGPNAYDVYPAGWALAGNTPGRYWSGTAHEGGVRAPFIVSWPKGIAARGELRTQLVDIADVAPTLLDLVGIDSPAHDDTVLDGKSFATTLANASAPSAREVEVFDTRGGRAVSSNGWKAVALDHQWPWSDEAVENVHWELYDLGADPNELRDRASTSPEKLAELRSIFDRAVHGTRTLDFAQSRDESARLYEGTTRATPEALSAPIMNRSHSISARVHVAQDVALDGVLATCGGRFGGYALYVKHGRLTYVHDYVGDARYTIESNAPVLPGERVLRFTFEKTGENSGHGRLFIDDVPVGEGDIPHTVPRLFSVNESCDTGVDTGTAAGAYEPPFAFTGRLHDVTITIDDRDATVPDASSDGGVRSRTARAGAQ